MSQKILENSSSQKMIIFLLGIIIVGGISLRLLFAHFELPLNSDNLQYFLYAIDHSLGEPPTLKVHNPGWPIFLSVFFSIFDSNNYLDFMALQKIISIIISSLTAIPIYFLIKKFFSIELAVLGSFLFVFEPRIIQNSTFGISDPLYIIGIISAIVFLLYAKKNFEFLAFMFLGLSIGIRSEGLFLIPAFIIIYFWERKISKESVIKILICLLIISSILIGITYYQNIENINNSLFSRIDSGIEEIYESPETVLAGSPMNLLVDGITNFIKFLGWSQFPIWMIFVPIGFILLLIHKNKETGIIITLLFFISLPTLYAFSFSNDTRYLFPLYPIFSLLSIFFINSFSQNKNFSIIKIGIIGGIIISSSAFLIWKDIDVDKEQEAFDLMRDISNNKIINHFGFEESYKIPVALEKAQIFPISSNEIDQYSTKVVGISRLNSLEEFMRVGFEKKLTHWAIKEKNHYSFLDEIFENENKYSFLTKEYDSRDAGHQIHLKIFKVNYENYNIEEEK